MGPFVARRAQSTDEIAQTRDLLDLYARPGPVEAILAAVAVLLSFKRDITRGRPTDDAAASIWRAILEPYPAWAVKEACIWWLSAANQNRDYLPVPGDIEEKVIEIMRPIRAAEIMCAMGPAAAPKPETERVPASPEARTRILTEAGIDLCLAVKGFGSNGKASPAEAPFGPDADEHEVTRAVTAWTDD